MYKDIRKVIHRSKNLWILTLPPELVRSLKWEERYVYLDANIDEGYVILYPVPDAPARPVFSREEVGVKNMEKV